MNVKELNKILELHSKWINGEVDGIRADLTGANLTGANLADANLAGADLRRANLRRANLTGANLADANLAGANLAGADLAGADLRRADLTGANLADANLAGADLRRADLRRANLRRANLAGANLTGVIGDMSYLRSMQIEEYQIVWTNEVLAIGCQQHTHEEWDNFSDEQISRMDNGALEWWKKWKEFIFTAIKMSKG